MSLGTINSPVSSEVGLHVRLGVRMVKNRTYVRRLARTLLLNYLNHAAALTEHTPLFNTRLAEHY